MKSFRKIQVIILSICLSLSTSFSMAGAHSRRTDAMGGHHDYQNKSGLGSYHYHCGGHPAHLHKNGQCPYSTTSRTTTRKTTKKVSKYYKVSTVRKVQKKLNKLGFKCGKADGHYGKKTKIAIRKYQRSKKGMAVNGKINKQLCKKLHIRI